jgi:CRISPR-associated exonuclease Cas4
LNLYWLIPFAVLCLALLFFLIARALRRAGGLPSGRIVYADPGLWGKSEKPLFDSALGLTGKPDYLLKRAGVLIPVEVKSMWAPREPYDSHVLQLGAYCLLVECSFGIRPAYGLLRYRNRTFNIPFTEALEEEVLHVVQEIRCHKDMEAVDRSHDHAARCARCGYRSACDQRL